jgi:hypothetical protein
MSSRSLHVVVHLTADVKKWAESPPDVEVCRPARCPRCGAASRPLGGRLGLWGHGLRDRQVRGPMAATHPAVTAVVRARRYVCRHCRATTTVLPRGAVARRHYSAGAIALACALYGVLGASLADTRARTSPWRSAEPGWPTLGRWLRGVEQRRLFPSVRPWPRGAPRRSQAERLATTAAAFAPADETPIDARAFAGAARAALG